MNKLTHHKIKSIKPIHKDQQEKEHNDKEREEKLIKVTP